MNRKINSKKPTRGIVLFCCRGKYSMKNMRLPLIIALGVAVLGIGGW